VALPQGYGSDVAIAGAWAAVLGGIPSTAWALLTGGDPLQATRAAGAMLIPSSSDSAHLIAAAVVVHLAVNYFWAAVLVALLPKRSFLASYIAAAVLIGLLDLKLIARAFFPEVHALPFLLQMADHVAWGAVLGVVRRYRVARREG
jgi:hypothetical protein